MAVNLEFNLFTVEKQEIVISRWRSWKASDFVLSGSEKGERENDKTLLTAIKRQRPPLS